MDRKTLRRHCLDKPGSVECYPYGDCVKAYKVGGKIFAFFTDAGHLEVSLKSDPMISLRLRKRFPEHVRPGFWNMQKKHWNTIRVKRGFSAAELSCLLDSSYELVFRGLTKSQRMSCSTSKSVLGR